MKADCVGLAISSGCSRCCPLRRSRSSRRRGGSRCKPVLEERPALHAAPRNLGSRLPPLYWADVPLWSPLDARCVSALVSSLMSHELVLQLVSGDTVGDWLGWCDGRAELAVTLEDWEERVDMSSKGPPCAASASGATPLSITLGSTV